jgi:hypothetical protein
MNRNKKLVPISNKFGEGAKASFFSNLLPKIVANRKEIKKSWALWNIVKAASEVDFDESRAKEIVYNYGVRTSLSIPKEEIAQPFVEVYKAIVSGGRSAAVRRVVDTIKRQTDRRSVLDLLTHQNGYASITGYFTRTIATDLNNCPNSIEFLKELIAGKKFYQANLNIQNWMKGEVEYNYVSSGKVNLKIFGDKSP